MISCSEFVSLMHLKIFFFDTLTKLNFFMTKQVFFSVSDFFFTFLNIKISFLKFQKKKLFQSINHTNIEKLVKESGQNNENWVKKVKRRLFVWFFFFFAPMTPSLVTHVTFVLEGIGWCYLNPKESTCWSTGQTSQSLRTSWSHAL